MEDIKVALHVFGVVLALGTGWRLTTYHFLASPRPALQHLGSAMAIQY